MQLSFNTDLQIEVDQENIAEMYYGGDVED